MGNLKITERDILPVRRDKQQWQDNPGTKYREIVYVNLNVTPTPSPSMSSTPSNTPSMSITPSISMSISVTPSITPSISISPSNTPSISVTPSISESPTLYGFEADIYECNWPLCGSMQGTGVPVLSTNNLTVGNYYYNSDDGAVYHITNTRTPDYGVTISVTTGYGSCDSACNAQS